VSAELSIFRAVARVIGGMVSVGMAVRESAVLYRFCHDGIRTRCRIFDDPDNSRGSAVETPTKIYIAFNARIC
jgi:hypothetical protein